VSAYDTCSGSLVRSLSQGQFMRRCTGCEDIVGKNASVTPHAGLRIESTAIRSEGRFEEYKCRKCGTRWHRILAKVGSGMEAQRWRIIGRTETHV
jgi:hypothetical protein